MKVGDLVKLRAWVHDGQTGLVVAFENDGLRVLLADSTIQHVHKRNAWVVS